MSGDDRYWHPRLNLEDGDSRGRTNFDDGRRAPRGDGRDLEALAKRVNDLELADRRTRHLIPAPAAAEGTDTALYSYAPGFWYKGSEVQEGATSASTMAPFGLRPIELPQPMEVLSLSFRYGTALHTTAEYAVCLIDADLDTGMPTGTIYRTTPGTVPAHAAGSVGDVTVTFATAPAMQSTRPWVMLVRVSATGEFAAHTPNTPDWAMSSQSPARLFDSSNTYTLTGVLAGYIPATFEDYFTLPVLDSATRHAPSWSFQAGIPL